MTLNVTSREFDEALDVIEALLDVANECLDGDDCEMWRHECPYHRAVDLLVSYGREDPT